MSLVTLARHAMATRFEMVLHGADPVALRAAGEEALAEVERLEAQLSLYRPESEIARLNARAAIEPVQVSPEVFTLLQQAQRLHAETGGAFDIGIGPLVRCWGFMGANGKMPTSAEVAEARTRVGMKHVQLYPQNRTVRFARSGVLLDLGAIGKGCAVDRAAAILREAGVVSALVHGGTSTVYAIGHPPDAGSWTLAVEGPKLEVSNPRSAVGYRLSTIDNQPSGCQRATAAPAPTISLCDNAMSVSAIWGRSFEADGRTYGHVIDPRTGHPVQGAWLAAVVLPSATETDALSTALLTLGLAGHEHITRLRPEMRTLLVTPTAVGFDFETRGMVG